MTTYEFEVDPIQFKALSPTAIVPQKGTIDSAGFDLYASEQIEIPPNTTVTIPLGFSTAMPRDIHARIESRSGMAIKGYVVLTGVIDADYRGEWKVILRNLNSEPYTVKVGERIAQAVFRYTAMIVFEQVSELSETSRGAGGFGSTGQA